MAELDQSTAPSPNNNHNNINSATMTTTNNNNTKTTTTKTKTKLKIKIKRYHAVAKWTWGVGDEEDVCIVCQSAFEGVAPGVKFPGDECPVVWGKCGHAFHLQCVSSWLASQSNNTNNTCPICRQDWEFAAEKAVDEGRAVGGEEGG